LSVFRGPNARLIFELLAQFKRGDCDGVKVRLGRLQEFISSACIEHLDFLTVHQDVDSRFRPFQEMEMEKRYRSLTDLPKMSRIQENESWVNYNVRNSFAAN
jgi:phosphorylase kinase alpha/beta subunit